MNQAKTGRLIYKCQLCGETVFDGEQVYQNIEGVLLNLIGQKGPLDLADIDYKRTILHRCAGNRFGIAHAIGGFSFEVRT